MLLRILRFPEGDGGTPPSNEPKPAPPAAAKTVANGKSETEIALEAKLATAQAELATEREAKGKRIKDLEGDVSTLQKKLQDLLNPPQPEPTPKAKSKSWFFEE